MMITVLVAGTNDPSNCNTLADAFIEGMKTVPGVHFEKVRIRELAIEHFTLERYGDGARSEEDFARMQSLIQSSQGLVIASPIWNFSVPAHLKNLIDRMGAFALDKETRSKGQWKGMPFYLIYTGGAPMIAWQALMYLTTLHVSEALKYYAGTLVGRHFEPKCMAGRGAFGHVVNQRPASLAAMRRAGERFARMTEIYARTGMLPIRRQFYYRFFTFLYRVGNRIMYPISTLQ